MPSGRAVNLISHAFQVLAGQPGWEINLAEELRCHPETPALTFRAKDTDIGLSLCPQCLRPYLQVGEGIICTSSDVQTERTCKACQGVYPQGDFIARTGYPTRFCSGCRAAWYEEKKKAEKLARDAAEAAEVDEVRKTLAAMRLDLRRIEAELGELE